jgi:hypothetical protein
MKTNNLTPFNTPLETGVRALTLLDAFFPLTLDLQRLVDFDYLVVHSGDAGGPQSLHPPLPLRSGELLVRHEIIEKGLLLMMSRGLVCRILSTAGIQYQATDSTNSFLNGLSSSYIAKLRERANWVAMHFRDSTDKEIEEIIRHFFKEWTTKFQPFEQLPEDIR